MKNKNKIIFKILINIIFLNIILVNNVFGSVYNYNIASVETKLFNNGEILSSGPSAKVIVKKNTSYSGIILTSIGNYNQVTLDTRLFNNGEPLSSGPSAKVNLMLTEQTQSGLTNIGLQGYNTVTIDTRLFNNGEPLSSGPSAKVIITPYESTSTGSSVSISENFNTVTVDTRLFNNGEPLSSGPSAKVEVISNELREGVIQTIDDSKTDIEGRKIIKIIETDSPDSSSSILINSKKYIISGQKPDLYNYSYLIEKNGGFTVEQIPYIKSNKGSNMIFGENNIFQNILKYKGNGNKIQIGDKLNVSMVFDSEIEYTDLVNITNIPVNPILVYPYKLKEDMYYNFNIATNIIKGMAYPNSVIKGILNEKIYYVHVDEKGLFEFKIDKFDSGDIGSIKNLIFDYVLIDGKQSQYVLGNAIYKIKLTNDNFTQPYISNIYNDDDIYSNVLYFNGYSNSGTLNYIIKDITDTNILLSGSIIVLDDKKFEILLLDKLAINQDYIVEMWNDGGQKERKAFTLKGNTFEKIGILSHSDYDISITERPTIIGYSKHSIMNNDTIRATACEIGDGNTINECPEDKKRYIGTVNSDKNGLFKFENINDFEDGKIYLIDFYNTSNMKYHKSIILKINKNSDIKRSNLVNLINGITVNQKLLRLVGYTLSGATIEFFDNNGNIIGTTTPNKLGYFEQSILLPNNNIFKIKYSKGSDYYEYIYTLKYNENLIINNSGNNYFQDFDYLNFNIIDIER